MDSDSGLSADAISEALEVIREAVMSGRYEGIQCPACDQMAKVYRRPIHRASVLAMARIYTVGGRDFVHIPTVLQRKQADEAKLRYWGLIEEMKAVRPDGGRAGYWRITEKGENWLYGRIAVEKYALIYDSELLALDSSDGYVTAQECLGSTFNLSDLMAGI